MEGNREQQVLFRVAGDVYKVGDCHYEIEDVFTKPLRLKVSHADSALSVIDKLFMGAGDDCSGICSLIDEGSYGRINVLYHPDIHDALGLVPLNGEIKDLFLLLKYDFFVAGENGTERFRMISPDSVAGLGRVLYKGEPLHRKVKIRDIFGRSNYIELSHLGSPDVAFTSRTDHDVVRELEIKASSKIINCITKEFNGYAKNFLEELSREDLDFLHALIHSIADRYDSLPASSDDVLSELDNAEDCISTMCECSRESYLVGDVERILYGLKDRGIIFEEGGYFSPTKQLLQKTHQSATDKFPEVEDHPDQSYFDFYER